MSEKVLRELLVNDFQNRRLRRGAFSLRAYARFLGINPTTLSLFLRGERSLKTVSFEKIARRLEVNAPSPQEDSAFSTLDLEKARILYDWHFFAILSLSETRGFIGKLRWISKRLGISPEATRTALELLEKHGFLRARNGVYEAVATQLRVSDSVPPFFNRNGHHQSLALAAQSLDQDAAHVRDFSSMTIAIDPEELPYAAQEIKKFRRRLSRRLERKNQREVYQLAIQLFPLSRSQP
ncbi:DUF4423 domain-containing protein [bacterium]|nr:DUF4423 domain-containing protein [bacterium]